MKLVIAEKPSVAKTIGKVLGATDRQDGYLEGNGWVVSWCYGHLAEYATPDVYNDKYIKWEFDDLPIIPDEWQLTVSSDKREQLGLLKGLLNRSDCELAVNACDAGREGELIFDHVYELSKSRVPVQRLWVSSLEESAVQDAFHSLRSSEEMANLREAAKCRAKADWLVGMNATRAYTTKYFKKLTVGRVQTPTLAMLVARQNEIDNFVKEPYWKVSLVSNGLTVTSDQYRNETEADETLNACQGQDAIITKAERVKKKSLPPKLYDLTTLQREANRLFGYTAKKTLDIVQNLYENKLVTYPRTDSQYITDDMQNTVAELLRELPSKVPCLSQVPVGDNIQRITDNSKVSDHTALLPTKESMSHDLSQLEEANSNIFTLICQRLAQAVSEECVYETTQVTAECKGREFKARGRVILSKGYRAVGEAFLATVKRKKPAKTDKDDDNEKVITVIPDWVVQGAVMPGVTAEKTQHFTSPPKPYTEDTLLAAMETAGNKEFDKDTEKKGLGTPATRASIIDKLVMSEYAVRDGKNILPKEDGKVLIEILPDILKSASMTAEWENELLQMERGQVDPDAWLRKIYKLLDDILKICEDIPDSERNRFRHVDSIGKCPACGGEIYETKNNFCCTNKDCQFVLWKNNRFLESMRKTITLSVAKALLEDGRCHMTGLYSKRTGKTFDADLVVTPEDGRAKFSLDFDNNR